MRLFFRLSFFLTAAALTACVRWSPPAMQPTATDSCRSTSLRWISPADSPERKRLDAWCAGVGPAVIRSSGALVDSSRRLSLSDVTFVSWNVQAGNGDVRAFVNDLRAGKLAGGRRVDHFVLMLQEAVRRDGVPTYSRDAAGARRISTRDDSRADIVELSRELDLALIYVPSMRNGNSPENPPSDRGNAILSTVPLSDPVAVELPGERQRRVAIMATVALSPGAGSTTAVSVGAIHLDALGAPRRLWVFWTPWMRELQAKSLEAALPLHEGAAVLGADLNTWHGKDELAVRVLDRHFQRSRMSGQRVGLGFRVLDYLFLRAADNRSARYEQLEQAYGSDHRPIVGWFE